MKVAGFAAFASQSGELYEIKWEIKVNESVITSGHQKNAEITDKHFVKIMLDDLVDVPANAPLDITVWIAKDLQNRSYVDTYYGSDGSGQDHKNLENEHKGLFEIENNPQS